MYKRLDNAKTMPQLFNSLFSIVNLILQIFCMCLIFSPTENCLLQLVCIQAYSKVSLDLLDFTLSHFLGPRIFFGGGGVPRDNFIFRNCVINFFGLNYCSCETTSIKDIFNAYIFAFLRWFYLGNNEVTGAVTRLKSICIVCNL